MIEKPTRRYDPRLGGSFEGVIWAARIDYDVSRVPDEAVEPPHAEPAPPRKDGAPSFDSAHLYGVAGEVASTLAPWTEAEPVALYATALTVAGLLMAPGCYANAGMTKHTTRLYTCTFGPTGRGRKGTGANEVRAVFEEALPGEPWESYQRRGTNTAEGLQDRFAEIKTRPRRILAFESEYGRLLKLADRESNIISEVIRDLWDFDSTENGTRQKPIKLRNAQFGFLAHITGEEAAERISRVDVYNGTINRILWVYSERRQLIAEPEPIPVSLVEGVADRLGRAIKRGRSRGRLARSAAARRVWTEMYRDAAWGADALPPRVAAVTERRDAQQLRLQLLFAALDGSSAIRTEHVEAAAQLWDYCARSALLLYADTSGDSDLDKVLTALRVAPVGVGLMRTELRSRVLHDNCDADRMDDLRAAGAVYGLKVRMGVGRGRGGPKAEWWYLEAQS